MIIKDLLIYSSAFFISFASFGKTRIRSDKAIFYKQNLTMDLIDNVVINSNNGVISGKRSKVFFKKKKNNDLELEKMSVFDMTKYQDKEKSIFADTMRYYKKESIIEAESNVVIKSGSSTIKTAYFAYDEKTNRGKFLSDVEYGNFKKIYPIFSPAVIKYIANSLTPSYSANKAIDISKSEIKKEPGKMNQEDGLNHIVIKRN